MTTDVNINLECTKNKRGSIPLGIPLSSSHKSSDIFLDKTEYSDMEVDRPATVAIHSSQEGISYEGSSHIDVEKSIHESNLTPKAAQQFSQESYVKVNHSFCQRVRG